MTRPLAFYVGKLGFELVEDTRLSDEKRWVRVAPRGSTGCCVLLAKAASERQRAAIGNQSGGRVFLFLHTDDVARDYARLVTAGVKIVREPSRAEFGTAAVFEDPFGNCGIWCSPA
jgi:catechol 2,3-dioxygenase-like lactoylglutathione lyase family enzyme